MLNPPKVILFDWDNTLVDTWPTIHDAINHTMQVMGHPEWSFDKVKSTIKQSMRDAFPVLFGDEWEKAADAYQSRFRAIHLERLHPLGGAEAMLKYLRTLPLFVAVVSNKKGVNLRKEVEHLGWNVYFDAVVGAQDAEFDKPDPAPARMALAHAPDHLAEDVWFVGDTGVDLECAKNIGATGILYSPEKVQGHEFEGSVFHARVSSHQEFETLLQTLLLASSA